MVGELHCVSSVLDCFSVAIINIMTQNNMEEKKDLFGLPVTVHYGGKPRQGGRRNLEAGGFQPHLLFFLSVLGCLLRNGSACCGPSTAISTQENVPQI